MPTIAWMSWIALVMAVALITTNPLYLAIVFLSVALVGVLAPKTNTGIAGIRALLIFGASMFAMSLVVSVINGNYGDHILFTIPGPHTPGWLGGLRIGGPVSAEGLAAASIRGLAILCVLLGFGVFNGAVSPHRVLRSAPAALFHAGLVVTVGLTLLPTTIEDVRRIREMRQLRGARSGIRDLPALVVPAVIGGLERSMRLAEAMEARGYGSAPEPARGPRLLGAAAAPLMLAAVSVWFYYPDWKWLGGTLGVSGLAALAAWGWLASRTRRTTRLHTESVPAPDRVLAAASLAGAMAAVAVSSAGWIDLGYNPFAGLASPPFELAGALVALSVAWPAVRLAVAAERGEEPAVEPEPVRETVTPGPVRP